MSLTFKKKQSAVNTALNRLRNVSGLIESGLVMPGDTAVYEDITRHYDIGISEHVLGTIADKANSMNDPVGRQYVPSPEELYVAPNELGDPIGDQAHSPVKGIVHRHPDRVLLKVSSVCAVYCRFCFRREMIGVGAEHLSEADLAAAMAYISENKSIWEVILTGGDPLVLSSRRLGAVFDALNDIKHVQTIRIHSRVPVACPDMINDTMLCVFKYSSKPISLVLHINHVQEITEKIEYVISRLRQAGLSLFSQSVLLKNVNDDAVTLEALFRALVQLHVKPYYLHHPDLAKGTSHFRVSIKQGQEIMRTLRSRMSGLCLPSYVLDIPGGYGKVPLEGGFCEEREGGAYSLTDLAGKTHIYREQT